MILDFLHHGHRYAPLHRHFGPALEYLQGLTALPAERVSLDGDQLFVLFSHQLGKQKDEAFLEAHRRYIDIHCCFDGREEIGWRGILDCTQPRGLYDEAKDFSTFHDTPACWSVLTPGMFAIYFPEDAHAPMVSNQLITKAVVKVAV